MAVKRSVQQMFSSLKATKPLKRSRLKPHGKRKPPKSTRIDYSLLPLAKPEKRVPVLREYPDGRIVYNLRHPQGALLYEGAKNLMADRQGWLCSICGKAMLYEEVSFEHGNLRGAGKRNDDPLALDPGGYFWNSAAHGTCNGMKGSRRDYPMAIRLKPDPQLLSKDKL